MNRPIRTFTWILAALWLVLTGPRLRAIAQLEGTAPGGPEDAAEVSSAAPAPARVPLDPTPAAVAGDHMAFLPAVTTPALAVVDAFHNPSFEEGWTDLPPVPGFIINQQPNFWTLTWVEIGEPLYDSGDIATGICECIHKLAEQLPEDQRPGGSDPLILDGNVVYKIFHRGAKYGAQLHQIVEGLAPGTQLRLTVPIRAHLHGLADPFGAESGVWVNGIGGWANAQDMGDEQWYEHEVAAIVPATGQIEILVRVKSKWEHPVDFFIDHLQLEQVVLGQRQRLDAPSLSMPGPRPAYP